MREATYSFAKALLNSGQIKEINSVIKKNLITNLKDAPAISAVVFPSFTNYKVSTVVSGNRHTLAIWMSGPKFR